MNDVIVPRYGTFYRHSTDMPRHRDKMIPFEFVIELPSPLRSGVDYGFLPGTNTPAKSAKIDRNTSA